VDGDVALLADFFSQIFVAVGANGLLLLGILILVSQQSLDQLVEGVPKRLPGSGVACASGTARLSRDQPPGGRAGGRVVAPQVRSWLHPDRQ
jgi:hypothetical protein